MADEPGDELAHALAVLLTKSGALQGALAGAVARARPRTTVRALWLRYWRAEGHALDSSKTEDGRMRALLEIEVPTEDRGLVKFGDVEIHEVTCEMGMSLLERYAKTTTKYGTHPKPGTRNRCRTRLKRLFQWEIERPRAVRELDENPLRGLPMEKEDNVKRSKIAKEETLAELLRHASPLAKAFILTCIDTGMREAEVCALQWPHIDEQTGRVSLLALDRKNDEPLAPRLSARALEACRALRVPGVPWVFANPKTKYRYHTRWITEHFYDAVATSGLTGTGGERITPHTLRHSFVYKARVLWKLPQRTVRAMIGQKTDSAFNRYGIVDQEEMDAAYEVRDAAIMRELAEQRAPAARASHADVGAERIVPVEKKSNR